MLELKNIDLKDVVLFKDVSIPIDQNEGLVVIAGLNLDSHEPENTNGAGKSLLFSTLANVLFEATPLSAKKVNKKDILDAKKSSITLDYIGSNSLPYQYTQTASSYVVIEDGKDLGIGKQEVAKKKLAQTFPMSSQEFYSTCYIQNLKPLAFQHSTDAERLKFLTEMFDLHIFDHIRSQVHDKLKSIKDAEIEFKTLSAQLDEILRNQQKLEKSKLDKANIEKLKAKQETLQSHIKALIKEQQKLEDLKDKVSRQQKLEKEREKLQALLPNTNGLAKKNKKLIKQIDKYETYQEAYEDYKRVSKDSLKRVAELEEQLGSNKDLDLDQIRSKYEAAEEALEQLEEQLSTVEKLQDELEDLQAVEKKLLKRLSVFDIDSTKKFDKDDLALYRNTIKTFERLSRHSHGDNCPTCGSELDIKSLEKMAKKASKKLDEYEKHQECLELQDDLDQVQKEIKQVKKKLKPLEDKKKLKKEIKKLKAKVEELETLGIALKTYKQEVKVIDGLTKPKKVDKPKTKLDVDELEEQLDNLQRLEIVIGKLQGIDSEYLDPTELSSRLKIIEKDLKKSSDRLDGIQTQLTSEKINKAELKSSIKQSAKLQKKLKKIESIVEERKLFEYLYKKYNANDLKLKAASSIMNLIEASLNTYSSLVFVEKTQFRLQPSKQGIVAEYKTEATGKWADIRNLSGAETNCFRLLFAISLLPLVPESRRTNFIILDEPDAACSEVTRQRLIKDFLPKLRSIVPHVFWITPKETDSFKEPEVWTVVKENGISSLKVG